MNKIIIYKLKTIKYKKNIKCNKQESNKIKKKKRK